MKLWPAGALICGAALIAGTLAAPAAPPMTLQPQSAAQPSGPAPAAPAPKPQPRG